MIVITKELGFLVRRFIVLLYIGFLCVHCKSQNADHREQRFREILPGAIPHLLHDILIDKRKSQSNLCDKVVVVLADNYTCESTKNSIVVDLTDSYSFCQKRNRNTIITGTNDKHFDSPSTWRAIHQVEVLPHSYGDISKQMYYDTIYSVFSHYEIANVIYPCKSAVLFNLLNEDGFAQDVYEMILRFEDEITYNIYYYNRYHPTFLSTEIPGAEIISDKVVFIVDDWNSRNRVLVDFMSQFVCE